MLIPRLSPGFLIRSTVCGVSQDDDSTCLSLEWRGGDVLALEDSRSNGDMVNGDNGKSLNELSESSLTIVESVLTKQQQTALMMW